VTDPWLVVIDPQRIFAETGSDWASPMWPDAAANILLLAAAHPGRIVITRWVAPTAAQRHGSWASYMEAWPFADKSPDDPAFDLVDAVAHLDAHLVSEPTFGKWRRQLTTLLGPDPHVVLAGVSTDCCVISTALPAADAGATITIATDACAGSTPENHEAALAVLGLYPPQITLATTEEILATRST
jgi:nicotinamidase-related amidase